jgi:hypothetical protein
MVKPNGMPVPHLGFKREGSCFNTFKQKLTQLALFFRQLLVVLVNGQGGMWFDGF